MPIDQLEVLLDNPSMQEALAVILDRSNGGNEELTWRDVRDALSSGQWGRLIEQEVLVSAGTGFALAHPEQIRERLEDRRGFEQSRSIDLEVDRWSAVDKAAGLFALLLMAGYWSRPIRSVIASSENVVLRPLTEHVPFFGVIMVLAVLTGLVSTVVQSRLTDYETLNRYQQRMQSLRERTKAARERGDDEALERLREEQMAAAGDQMGLLKLQFRPMVWIMLLTIPVFLWLRWQVVGGHLGVDETGLVIPIAGAVSWRQPLVGPMQTWLVWYFLCSMIVRQICRKAFNAQRSTKP